MELYDVVKKLIGPINPLGDSSKDSQRLENLKQMTGLIESLITDIDDIAYENRHSHEHSVIEIAKHAHNFMIKLNTEYQL